MLYLHLIQTLFELGVRHREIIGELIVGLFFISGGGSVILGGVKAFKVVELFARAYKRINPSPTEIFEDAIDAVYEAFMAAIC